MTVRVLIVDDSSFLRKQIIRLLESDTNIVIIGIAGNGAEAVEKTLALHPDVITMDIEMPVLNGIEATKKIMSQHPTPILIFSSFSFDGAKPTLDALDAGAVDYMPKKFMDISSSPDEVADALCKKISDIARQSRISPKKSLSPLEKTAVNHWVSKSTNNFEHRHVTNKSNVKIIAIGTSTGGPVALQKILRDIPESFPLPILIMQHMPATFTPAFAKRLDDLCNITVKEAEDGDRLKPGVAYLAPGGKQMSVKGRPSSAVIEILDGDSASIYKPSVDHTFFSIEKVFSSNVLAVVLTGMGADGCKGAARLKKSGAEIIVQSERSCVVYGMPAAIVKAELADKILDLQKLSEEIMLCG